MRNILLLFIVLIATSCTKTEDVLVSGNTPPIDSTIENTTIENYINKLYISTIGREPTTIEFDANFTALRDANLSQQSREQVIAEVLGKEGYYNNLFKLESANILNGVDTTMVNERVFIYQSVLVTASGIDSIYILNELERILEFQHILSILSSGSVTSKELYKHMVNNDFFDEINMGTENFVVAMFQHFLLRYPTNFELENAKTMVDDGNATVFFEAGRGKEDFLDIFFSSNEYHTGQTSILFNRYLFRPPTSEESINYSLDYINTNDYKALQTRILATNEFIGL